MVGATRLNSASGRRFMMTAVSISAPPLLDFEFFFGMSRKNSCTIRRFATGSYDPNIAATMGKNHSQHAYAMVGCPTTSGMRNRLYIRCAIDVYALNRGM